MSYLLDVNVLIALIDAEHVHHELAHRWFQDRDRAAWATCPITQNGVIRIVGHSRYSEGRSSPAMAMESLDSLVAVPGHEFWPDDLSLLASSRIDRANIATSAQITDTYLLALAAVHGGMLATLDRRLVTGAVAGGCDALHLIE